MIVLFGRIRFRRMDLLMRTGSGFCHMLVRECWGRSGSDPRGEEVSPKGVRVLANNSTAKLSLGPFDLSRNKLLWTLKTTARSVDSVLGGNSPDTASSLPEHVLSTIISPAFFQIVVVSRDYDFHGLQSAWEGITCGPLCAVSQTQGKRKPHGTIVDSNCSARCTKRGDLNWCCVWMFGTLLEGLGGEAEGGCGGRNGEKRV